MRDENVNNAKSRRDHKTYICVACGTTEALIDGGFEEADEIETAFVSKVKS